MEKTNAPYVLDDQIGFVLRRVTQRHIGIFTAAIAAVTTTQFAALAKLAEFGPLSQNHLGRVTAMDAATIKGVVDRLRREGLVATTDDTEDRRRLTVALTDKGAALFRALAPDAIRISAETLAPLSPSEQATLLALLARLT